MTAASRLPRPTLHAVGVALVIASGLTLLLAFFLGPLLVGSLGGRALLAYLPERVLLALCGGLLAVGGWILCGSTQMR